MEMLLAENTSYSEDIDIYHIKVQIRAKAARQLPI